MALSYVLFAHLPLLTTRLLRERVRCTFTVNMDLITRNMDLITFNMDLITVNYTF